MGPAADNVGNGSATPSELGRSSLVTDGSNVTDETVLLSAANDHTGDKRGGLETVAHLTRDQRFESGSLQRRVRSEPRSGRSHLGLGPLSAPSPRAAELK